MRAQIAASDETANVLALRFGITEQTVYKWKKRESVQDRSHTAHRLQTQLTPAQEVVVVHLRRALLLPLDDLLAVTREFICSTVSRSGLDRCLHRHGVGNLNAHIPMARGFVYLAAVIDWYSRRVLAWRLSISMDTEFCIEAVQEAIARYGTPDIFNTDQGSQFTSAAFTGLLIEHGIRISMDGKGCWRDNVFIERLWRSIKYEVVYLHAYERVSQARAGIGRYIEFYNTRRPHSSLQARTPDVVYFKSLQRPSAQAA